MIDILSLGLTHALMMVAAWRLVRRPDLDREPPVEVTSARWGPRDA